MTGAGLRSVGEQKVAAFETNYSKINPTLCGPFHAAAGQLEADLVTLYQVVVTSVREEDDLEAVANWWGAMIFVCDAFLKKVQQLVDEHPFCDAEVYRDKMLDLRNKCQRLQNMHK